jgi:hypothetical protein
MTKLKDPESKGGKPRLVTVLFNSNYCEAKPPLRKRKITFAHRQEKGWQEETIQKQI